MSDKNNPGFRILIVDDNESIHTDLKKILQPAKDDLGLLEDEALLFGAQANTDVVFQIDSAFQGQEGLARLVQAIEERDLYSLAFVDIRMPPGWDGIETISRLWARDPNLQVVVCTAYSDYNWRDIERQLGLSHNLVILKKPFDPIEVTQLAHALTAKWEAARLAQIKMERLDRLVEERTSELLATVRELEEAKAEAEKRSLEDPLTKLANRRLFLSRVGLALKRAQANKGYLCAVLFLDVDRFKIVNDSLGHQAGDELLMEMSRRLKTCLREGAGRAGAEDVISRLGGDEFAILLDGVRSKADAVQISERIRNSLAAPFQLRGRDLSSSVSVGIVTCEDSCTDPETMMRDADTAMYRAKAAGGGVHMLYDESMHLKSLDKLHQESEIRQALERHEFWLAYQPVVSLITGEVEGFEALLRWDSPTRGMVGPAEFIGLSEETGLIIPLGGWVLDEACRQIGEWYGKFGPNFRKTVSVNISARQFLQPGLVSTVEQAMRNAAVRSANIRLELTETVTMQDPRLAASMLSQLQLLGVRLSIDDFGTGYSSLNYLHRFSVDTLKIDQSFVSNMTDDERSLNIVRTIISLAHNLHMGVIAEGVETEEQARLLVELGCDSAQGYYFSRPVRAAEIEETIAKIAGDARRLGLPKALAFSA